MSAIDYPPADATRDAVLAWVARELEQGNFLDLRGIASRRKRDREDADLRMRARQEMRREFADYIRAMAGREDLEPAALLRQIAALSPTGNHAAHLIDAWPLAWSGWVVIECILKASSNWIPPEQHYRITLTTEGRVRAGIKDENPA